MNIQNNDQSGSTNKGDVYSQYVFKQDEIDAAITILTGLADPAPDQKRFLPTVIVFRDETGKLQIQSGTNTKGNDPELLLALIEKICDSMGDKFGTAINAKNLQDAKHIHQNEENLLHKLENINKSYPIINAKLQDYRERVEKHGAEIYTPSAVSQPTSLQQNDSFSDFELISPTFSVGELKRNPSSESLSPPPSPVSIHLPQEKPPLVRQEKVSVIHGPMDTESIEDTIPALRSVGARQFLVSFVFSSYLKQAARKLADGQQLGAFPDYDPRYDNSETSPLSNMMTLNPNNAANWTVFYAKMCVIDADPDFNKLHRDSQLAQNALLMGALRNGISTFKEIDSKMEASSLPTDQPDRVLARNIAKTFSSVASKLERTPSEALDLYTQDPAERHQIHKELLDIARGWHKPQEAEEHQILETATIPIGTPDNMVRIHLQGKKDLERESVIIGDTMYLSPGNNLSQRNAIVHHVKSLFKGDKRITNELVAEILTLTCAQTVFAPLQIAAMMRPNSHQLIQEEESRINSVKIDFEDVVFHREISFLAVDPDDPEKHLPERTKVAATIRIPKETFLSHRSLQEVSDQECREWQVMYTITRNPI